MNESMHDIIMDSVKKQGVNLGTVCQILLCIEGELERIAKALEVYVDVARHR